MGTNRSPEASLRESRGAGPGKDDGKIEQVPLPTRTGPRVPLSVFTGTEVEFVRWEHTRNGWDFQLLRAVYRGRTKSDWHVEVDLQLIRLPRTDWQLCIT